MADSIFVVVGLTATQEMSTAIEAAVAGKFLRVRSDTWLVTDSGTSAELSAKLNITGGSNGTALIFSINGYSGWAPVNIWEWLKANRGESVFPNA